MKSKFTILGCGSSLGSPWITNYRGNLKQSPKNLRTRCCAHIQKGNLSVCIDTSPDIKIEETSSGGSKRLSLGVESDGTPFISAEQSGGQIEVQLSGNNEFQFLNGGRFRVTRTGVPAYISRGPVTGVTVDHGLSLIHI